MKQFIYTVQFKGVAKNNVGRKQSIILTQSFIGTIEESTHKNHESGKQLSTSSLYTSMKSQLDLHVSNEKLIANTIDQISFIVHTEDKNVVLYMDKKHPSTQSTNGSQFVHAFFIESVGVLSSPKGTSAQLVSNGIRLSWNMNTHHDGIHIYNAKRTLITTLARGTQSWIYPIGAKETGLYEFYISSYYQKSESEPVKVFITVNGSVQTTTKEDKRITSFQSGVGGGDDLQVSIDKIEGSELFTYTVQLKGQKGNLIHYGPKISNESVHRVFSKGELILDDEVLNPLFDTSLNTIDIKDWSVLLESSNPNVKLSLVSPLSMEMDELRYFPFQLSASIKNPTQTPWNPLVHTGYYYINEKERYLYSEVHVEGRPDEGEDFAQLHFVYSIKATYLDGEQMKEVSKVFVGKVSSDQRLHRIDDRRIEIIMKEELAKKGFKKDIHTVSKYEISVGSEYPVGLSVRSYIDQTFVYGENEAGEGCIYAQTDGRVVDYIYETSKVYVDEQKTAIIHPAPKQGAPVIIEKNGAQSYQQVFFYDEQGKPSIYNTEQKEINSQGEVYLSHTNIDNRTMKIHVNSGGKWVDNGDFVIQDNKLTLNNYGDAHIAIVKYAIIDSFSVDYNYSHDGEYAKLTFYDIDFQKGEENYIKVSCETGDEPLYKAREVDLNPLKTTMHTGFLYISDEKRVLNKIELSVPNTSFYADKSEFIRMRAYTLDSVGDPVSDIYVDIKATAGEVTVVTSRSSIDGMIEFDYTPPLSPQVVTLTVQAIAVDISASTEIEILPYERKGRMFLRTSAATIAPGAHPVDITANVYDSNQEPNVGGYVTFSTSSGYLETNYGTTNKQGQVTVRLHATEIPKTGIIEIDAVYEKGNLFTKTVVRIEGYRYYHPDLLIRGNNLIDLYDAIETKKNLGINVHSEAPKKPGRNDIWIDDSDMTFLIQQYELSDLRNKDQARSSLGIHVGTIIPKTPWPNDMIIEDEDSGQKKGDS